jgi:hypothetical protein
LAGIHSLGVVHVSPQERLRQRAASRREVLRQANRANGLKFFDRDQMAQQRFAVLYYSMERYEDAEILLMIAETKALFGEHQWMTTLAIEV